MHVGMIPQILNVMGTCLVPRFSMGTVAIAILYMTLVMLALGCVHATMPADNINGSPRGTTPRNNHARVFEGGACAPDAPFCIRVPLLGQKENSSYATQLRW